MNSFTRPTSNEIFIGFFPVSARLILILIFAELSQAAITPITAQQKIKRTVDDEQIEEAAVITEKLDRNKLYLDWI